MIRQAVPEDRAAIQRLYESLCPREPVHVIASRIEQIQEDAAHFLLVHVMDGKVNGSIFLSFCPNPMFGTLPFAVVENLIVDPQHRGGGIGRKLMQAAEELARENRCTKLMLLSAHAEEQAQRFFGGLGYASENCVGFEKNLGTSV
ncbi:MAG: GNAT family N-acetyltransferase [Tumebacillaceae bacterium]